MKKLEKYRMGITITVFSIISCNPINENESKNLEVSNYPVEGKNERIIEDMKHVDPPAKILFKSNGCVACHQANKKVVGPSLKVIAEAYKENKGGLIAFFKGEEQAIVDVDQAAVMVPFISVTKEMTDSERTNLANYILDGNY